MGTQTLPEQALLEVPTLVWQTLPQTPQLLASLVRLRHTPEQLVGSEPLQTQVPELSQLPLTGEAHPPEVRGTALQAEAVVDTHWMVPDCTQVLVPPDEHPWIEEFGATYIRARA